MSFLTIIDEDGKWALGYDENQWHVLRAKMRRGERDWDTLAFIGSTKTTLLLSLDRRGVQITSDARALIDAMPERFLDWIAGQVDRYGTFDPDEPASEDAETDGGTDRPVVMDCGKAA